MEPCGIVIFGASGDLTARKLLPALYDLHTEGRLTGGFYVLGVARREWSSEEFRQRASEAIKEHSRFGPPPADALERFLACIHYLSADATNPAAYPLLSSRLNELDNQCGVAGNRLFYLSVAPSLYETIVENLGAASLAKEEKGWRRIIIEKPFGHDLKSACDLTRTVQAVFHEEQVYRIDHYLGKETVQNVSVFRFANSIFEPIWNRKYIDHVQITVAEQIDVGARAGYYDRSGALRDMIQNHLLQVLCLVAMEPPSAFAAAAVRREKLKVLQSIRPMTAAEVGGNALRGQYQGYRDIEGVADDSATETFAALRLVIDDWRWAGVPFYLRTGKSMAGKVSEVSVQFKEAPLQLFACTAMQPCEPNLLRLRIQPDEGIGLRSIVKTPGLDVIGHPIELDFTYAESFEGTSPTAYETLLLDCLQGDNMLFASGEWIERSWELMMPVLKAWEGERPSDFPNYAPGSWGPDAADELLTRDNRKWHLP